MPLDRRRRQQRQDHRQGNDRGHPRARGQHARHARQPQQPHRRAADAASGSTPRTASRSSRWAPITPARSRDLVTLARPTVGLITNAGAEHLEGFGSLEGVARAEGEMVAGLDARGDRRHQCRRRVRRPVARHDARRASSTFGVAQPARLHGAPTCAADDRRRRASSRASRCVRRTAACRSSCTSPAGTTCSTRCARRPRRAAAGASLDDVARGPCHDAPGSGPIAVQNRAERRLAHRRLLQRQSRAR